MILLENTRFHLGDTANSAEFAKSLAALCDVFVNDAFGVVHRDQGSVTVSCGVGWSPRGSLGRWWNAREASARLVMAGGPRTPPRAVVAPTRLKPKA